LKIKKKSYNVICKYQHVIREIMKIPHAVAIMEILYEEGETNIGLLAARMKKNYYLLKKSIQKLEELGMIVEKERGKGIILSLTDRGKEVYEAISKIDATMSPDWKERFKHMRAMVHFNMYENTIRISEYLPDGRENIVDVDVTINGRRMYLYCEACGSFNCEHINFIWSHPKLRRALLKKAQEKHLIIVEPEQAENEMIESSI